MKKTLIALAALAATGASFAQVTLYGVVDGAYQNSKTSQTIAGTTTDTRADGIVSNSAIGNDRWGIKGEEDLGGGLKALFQLEAQANTSDGTQNTAPNYFNRTSIIGLSGGFGTVKLGLTYTPLYNVLSAADPFDTTGISTVNLTPAAGTRASNAVFYTTPNFGGFTVNAMYGNNDTGTSAAAGASVTKNTGLSVGYASGPLAIAYGLGVKDTSAGLTDSKSDGSALSATYDFGAAKLFAGYTKGKAQGTIGVDTYTENTETTIGVTVPMGALTLLGALGRNTRTEVVAGVEVPSVGTTTANASGTGSGNDWALGAYYNLSKRTVAFVKTGVYDKFDFGATTGTGTANSRSTTATAIGIRHAF